MTSKMTLEEIYNFYHEFLNDCDNSCWFTNSYIIQEKKVLECTKYIEIIKNFKYQAQHKKDNFNSNIFFHMQCTVNAVKSLLLMWTQLKKEKFYEAWTSLIDAQEYSSIALKVETDNKQGVLNLQNRLRNIEKSIFPSQNLYMSAVLIETVGNCSVCNSLFIDCNHIENEIYTGSLCQRINRKIIDIKGFDLVKNPFDRRCIITTFYDNEGNEINRFTGDKTGEVTDSFKSVVFRFQTLDLF